LDGTSAKPVETTQAALDRDLSDRLVTGEKHLGTRAVAFVIKGSRFVIDG
jgi:hypothetical protein